MIWSGTWTGGKRVGRRGVAVVFGILLITWLVLSLPLALLLGRALQRADDAERAAAPVFTPGARSAMECRPLVLR
jgi:hypothetical protein